MGVALRTFIITLLAWLGLAGIADNVVEWQRWFELGVMEHWRSVKVWIMVVLFDWLPFQIPSWIIDYMVIGLIVWRPTNYWSIYPPLRAKPNELYYWTYGILTFVGVLVLSLLIWPITLLGLLVGLISSSLDEVMQRLFGQMALSFLSFVPFLFVTSTLLYQFG